MLEILFISLYLLFIPVVLKIKLKGFSRELIGESWFVIENVNYLLIVFIRKKKIILKERLKLVNIDPLVWKYSEYLERFSGRYR